MSDSREEHDAAFRGRVSRAVSDQKLGERGAEGAFRPTVTQHGIAGRTRHYAGTMYVKH
jgi:hypothetical protein